MVDNLPKAGAELTLELSEWERNWASAQDTADSVMTSILTDLEVDVTFTSSGEDTLPFDDIPESVDTELNVTEDEATKGLLDGLNFLVMKEKIKLAMDIIGNVWDFFTKIEEIAVEPFLDIEDAVAKINARTGGTGIEDLGQLIRDIQFADLGESADQIADVIIKAQQLGLPIEEAATAALTFTHTWTENDPSTVIGTLGTLVQTGLVDNLKEAADLMTVFFQQGGDVGGDALAVVEANAQAWADMGLTGAEALSVLDSLQQGTGATATDAAKMIQTFDDALTAAAADPGSAQAKMLKLMGIDNPKDQGQAIGAETINGFADAFANMPSDQQDLISGMFFGKGGKKFTGAIEGMTTEGGMFQNVVDAAETAAAAADDSLRGIIDDFVLEINGKVSELLSSEAIDLPGKIEALKQGLQTAFDVLASGGTVGEAVEIGLNIPGFNDAVMRFESSIGNFVISVLEIIAGIQDFLGKDSTGTRTQITQLEQNQLPFNLKVSNSDEVSGEINTAIARGLSTDDILKAAGTAITELVSSGSSDDLDKAQALVDSIKELSGGFTVKPGLGGMDLDWAQRGLAKGSGALFETQLAQGNIIPITLDATDLQQQIDEATLAAQEKTIPAWTSAFGKATSKAVPEDLDTGRTRGNAVGEAWWEGFKGVVGSQQSQLDLWAGMTNTGDTGGGAAMGGGLAGIVDSFTTAANDLMTTSETATTDTATNWSNLDVAVSDNTATIIGNIEATAAKTEELDTRTTTALTDNTVTASFDAVAARAASVFPSVIAWFEKTAAASVTFDGIVSIHLRSVIKQLNDLNFLALQTIANVTSAQALGGSGGTVNNTTNNVTVNNNVQTGAQAAANGYAIGDSLRPGGG